jgi:hypothetical protein
MMLPWQHERRMPLTTALGRVTAGDSEVNRQVQSAGGLQSALPLSAPAEAAFATRSRLRLGVAKLRVSWHEAPGHGESAGVCLTRACRQRRWRRLMGV